MTMARLAGVALACAFGVHVALGATVVVPSELRGIIESSDLIVRGVVTDVRATRAPAGSVETVGTVAVESMLKGETGGVVFVRVPGGEMGRYRTVVVGAPVLKAGGRAVFFLARSADGGWRPVGMSAGVLQVSRHPQSGVLTVAPPIIALRATDLGPVVRGDTSRVPVRVAEFESLVRTVVAFERRAAPRGRP